MRKLALLALLSTCNAGTEPDVVCTSTCGMQLLGPVPAVDTNVFPIGRAQWTCNNWNAAEQLALMAFDKYVNQGLERTGNFSKACKQLRGWQVGISPTYRYMSLGQEVSGRTFCDFAMSGIGARPADESALTHEMMHIIQRCKPSERPGDCQTGPCDPYHLGWEEAGLNKAEGEALVEGKLHPGAPWGIVFEVPDAGVP